MTNEVVPSHLTTSAKSLSLCLSLSLFIRSSIGYDDWIIFRLGFQFRWQFLLLCCEYLLYIWRSSLFTFYTNMALFIILTFTTTEKVRYIRYDFSATHFFNPPLQHCCVLKDIRTRKCIL